ncbi:MAG: type VI secretion system baseplate subunit TssG [Rubrivivax sp.]|nr:type VI secretion system baseplate subunit TssG [Rubrivivax sp.]
MPAAQWPEPVAVVARLLDAPHSFGFFQAVRLLEQWFAREEGLTRTQMLGTRLAFRNSLSMAFPASEIESLRVTWRGLKALAEGDAPLDDGGIGSGTEREVRSDSESRPKRRIERIERIDITPAFMGLLGAGGALPSYYTELLATRETYHRDGAARAFMDIFLHRAVALFYQAWRKHRLPLQYEADRRNQYLPLMLSVAGIGHRGLRDPLRAAEGGVADEVLAHFAGALQRRPVSARTVQQLLAYYFRVPVEIEQFIGRWFTLPSTNQSVLGMGNAVLGRSAVVGERVWQRDLRLRLTLGPLTGARLKRFLPGGPGALALRELLGLLSGPTLEYEVRLALRGEDIRGARLDAADGPRLGWDSFLATQPQTGTRTDPGYDLLALA